MRPSRPRWACNLFLWMACALISVFLQELSYSGSFFAHGAIGNVIEEGEFVIVRTHDSGTFVGIKQHVETRHDSSADAAAAAASASGTSATDEEGSGTFDEAGGGLESRRLYYAFKGIPYAAKPLGNLRWKEPQAYDVKDSGPKDSTKYQSICSQWDSVKNEVAGSQDCLYLNIFTPRLFFSTSKPAHSNHSKFDDDPRETKRHLPVLLYVHDGDFVSGSGNLAPTSEQAFMKQDIILVTLNYRLGVFGFLSSGTSDLPGNYGLLDQISVLKWLQKNVHRFGGNSNRITIFGNTLFLQLSPLASGLFHNVILMQSTTTLAARSSSVLNLNPQDYFLNFAGAANCPVSEEELNSDSGLFLDTLNDCLRQKPAPELIQVQQSFYKLRGLPRLLTPIMDEGLNEFGDVLPRSALASLPNLGIPEETEPPPLMMGISARGEGLELFSEIYASVTAETEDATGNGVSTRKSLRSKLRRYLQQIIGSEQANNAKVFNGIWNYYFASVPFANEDPESEPSGIPVLFWSQLLQLFGDVTVYVPYWTLLKNLRQKESLKLFNYVFDPRVEVSQEFLSQMQSTRENEGGQRRTPLEEEFYLFFQGTSESQSDDSYHRQNQELSQLSDVMVNIWVSFAAYENPKNAITKHKNWSRWTKFGFNHSRLNQTMYYHIKPDLSQMEDNFKGKEAEFWLETLPTLRTMSSTVDELDDWSILFWAFISLTCILFLIVVAITAYMLWSKY